MANSGVNRPLKYGAYDRREYIVEDSEVSIIAINDTNGNPVFLGRAKTGTSTSIAKWQIRYIEYDSNQGVIRVTWPENDEANASTDYEFIWTTVSDLTITNISQDNPGQVTVSAAGSLQNGDMIVIQEVTGMTEVNFDGSNIYTVSNLSGTTFDLNGIDTTGFTAYSSGGIVIYGEVINYTYS